MLELHPGKSREFSGDPFSSEWSLIGSIEGIASDMVLVWCLFVIRSQSFPCSRERSLIFRLVLQARTILDSVLSHIEPPTSMSFEGSESGECRSSTSGCFSSMTESTSPTDHHHPHQRVPSYRLRLIDDTTSNDFAADDEDDHSDLNVRSLQWNECLLLSCLEGPWLSLFLSLVLLHFVCF